jgi:hypothetical protein
MECSVHGCACASKCMGARVHLACMTRRTLTRSHVDIPRVHAHVCTYMRMYVYFQALKANRHKKGGKGMPGVGRQIVARLQTLPFSLSGTFLGLDVI